MRRSGELRRQTQLSRSGFVRFPTSQAPRTRIAPVSAKRARENRTRATVLAEMRANDPTCAMCKRGGVPLDGHELLSRGRGGSITDPANIVLLCRRDHTLVTENPAWAEANGWAQKTEAS